MTRMTARTMDAYVVVPVIANTKKILAMVICAPFGVRKNSNYTNVQQTVSQLGQRPASALPMSHAFTGCGVSPLCWQRKGQGMESLASVPRGHLHAFLSLSSGPDVLSVVTRILCCASWPQDQPNDERSVFFKWSWGLEIIHLEFCVDSDFT